MSKSKGTKSGGLFGWLLPKKKAPASSPAPAQSRVAKARRDMIERVVAFDEKKVLDVMAPRVDVFAVDVDMPLQELIDVFAEAGHSRLPVFKGELDNPVGMIHIKDVVGLIAERQAASAQPRQPWGARCREVLYVPPSMLVTDLLLRMQVSRVHMALVIDEYGGTDGLVTIEDLIEEIVGEINDEHDDDAPSISELAGGGWVVDARFELDEFFMETGLRLIADEEEEVDTLGGFVVAVAGRVPRRGEIITWGKFDFEVAEADARKLRKLRVRPTTLRVRAAEAKRARSKTPSARPAPKRAENAPANDHDSATSTASASPKTAAAEKSPAQ